jgi:hypothetical protein
VEWSPQKRKRPGLVRVWLAMVLAHNIWSGGVLAVVVTLVGWMALIKSLFFLFLPHEMEAGLFIGQLHYRQLFYLYSAISLVLGVYLDLWRIQVNVALKSRMGRLTIATLMLDIVTHGRGTHH